MYITIPFLWMMKQAQRSTQLGTSIWTHVCSDMLTRTLRTWLKQNCGQLSLLGGKGVCVTEHLAVSICFSSMSQGAQILSEEGIVVAVLFPWSLGHEDNDQYHKSLYTTTIQSQRPGRLRGGCGRCRESPVRAGVNYALIWAPPIWEFF